MPWFHAKYCIEHSRDLRVRRSPESLALKEEVSDHLLQLAGGWRHLQEDAASEFHNQIDFELQLDQRGQFVDLSTRSAVSRKVSKFAVLVLPTHHFTVDTRSLSGISQSNIRELELQVTHPSHRQLMY